MQEENKKDVPMVDLDVSGEGAEIELEEQKPENEVETKEEDLAQVPKWRRLEKRKQKAATRSQKLNRKRSLNRRKKN